MAWPTAPARRTRDADAVLHATGTGSGRSRGIPDYLVSRDCHFLSSTCTKTWNTKAGSNLRLSWQYMAGRSDAVVLSLGTSRRARRHFPPGDYRPWVLPRAAGFLPRCPDQNRGRFSSGRYAPGSSPPTKKRIRADQPDPRDAFYRQLVPALRAGPLAGIKTGGISGPSTPEHTGPHLRSPVRPRRPPVQLHVHRMAP